MDGRLSISRKEAEKLVIRVPKQVAKLTIAGGVTIYINDTMEWTPPTPEQIKNLKEMFCIDVELLNQEEIENED